MQESLVHRIRELLRAEGRLTARELTETIDDPTVTRTVVNRLLHARQDVFGKSDDTPPLWSLRGSGGGRASSPPAGTISARQSTSRGPAAAPGKRKPGPGSRGWQEQALAAWRGLGHRAIVEAVEGAGKTSLGIAAAAEATRAGRQVVVLVRDSEDQHRWIEALRGALPDRSIAGSAPHPLPAHGDVTVVTARGAIQDRMIDRQADHPPTVLIVDDVHDYSAGAYAKALLPAFQWRLALTCGAERGDGLMESVVRPYFGEIVAGCDYLHAVQHGLLPRIRLAQVPVRLTASEERILHTAEDRAEQALDTLVGTYGAPDTRSAAEGFARAQLDARGPAAVFARRYLDALGKRSELLAGCQEKLALLRNLPVPALTRTQTIFFTDRPATATRLVQLLGQSDLEIARVGEDLAAITRDEVHRRLRERSLHAVVEHRGLDPALTVPYVGMGVFVSPDLTERQLAHRLGRVIHPDAPQAPVVLLAFVEGSSEDPKHVGAHLRRLRQIAEEEITTDIAGLPGLLDRWLAHPGPNRHPGAVHPTPAPGAPNPGPAASEPKAEAVMTELSDQLLAQGGIATADELGDLLGLTDPREMAAAVTAAAGAGLLDFRPVEDGTEELVLLAADVGGSADQRGAALERITRWAARSADPIEEFPGLVRAVAPLRVPRHRLVGIAAFLRGTTPAGLL